MRESIDGASFAQAHGFTRRPPSICRKQQINELNVSPRARRGHRHQHEPDLGTAAAGAAQAGSPTTVGEAAATNRLRPAAGARGNSGVILSLLFRGFAKAVKDKDSIDGRDLAIALTSGVARRLQGGG
ncbi:MAG: DAK2 domain-containing protein [Flavonifractor plautii]